MESRTLAAAGSVVLTLLLAGYVGSYLVIGHVRHGEYSPTGIPTITGASGPLVFRLYEQRWQRLFQPLASLEMSLFPRTHIVGFYSNSKRPPNRKVG